MPDNPSVPSADPRAEYQQRLGARRALADRFARLHVSIGNTRLALAVAAVGIGWLVFAQKLISPLWLLVPAISFVVLMVLHERVLCRRRHAERAAAFYERGLARLENRWAGKGEPGLRFADEAHPYAPDLDLFGKGGLFELLCTARTLAGEENLARFLLSPAHSEETRERQEAVEELRNRIDLREDLALLGDEVRTGTHAEALPSWGESPLLLDAPRSRAAAALLALAAAATAAGWAFWGLPPTLFLIVLAVEAGFALRLRSRVLQVVQSVEHPAHDLGLLSEILRRLEGEQFSCRRLTRLRGLLETEGRPASRRIARLSRLIDLLDSRDNVAVRLIGPPLLWTTQIAFAIEAWRKDSGAGVRRWIEAAGEMEALCALANFAYEHPSDRFPELVDGTACFDGEGLGHPLIPESRSVRNDVRLDRDLRVLVVSGSNMSGKSTLLRTVGTNAVLAMAGAPVRAARLRMSPFAIGASIRVTDSLQDGKSRFYAEITRLRNLLDIAAGQPPLLFLLDELMHGTNSHDRRIGAEGVVRHLVERGALGLITTHDLALAHIAEVLAPLSANVHFEDHIEDGRISFDYRMRPGVVRKSNALELMRSVGLDV